MKKVKKYNERLKKKFYSKNWTIDLDLLSERERIKRKENNKCLHMKSVFRTYKR